MAKAVMEAFPQIPDVKFETSKKAMKKERRDLALEILKASGTYTVKHTYSIITIYYVNE
jgi:hypothetical protein